MSQRNDRQTATGLVTDQARRKPVQHRIDFSLLPPEGFVRLPIVLQVTGLSRSHLYASIKKSRFPAPQKLSAHCSGWRVSDLREWLSQPSAWLPSN